MKVSLRERERALLSIALHKYDRLCQGTSANLTTLNLPNIQTETARGNIEVIRERLGSTTGDEIELQHDLIVTLKDALHFALTKYQKIENDQTELLVGTSETEEAMNEVRGLQRKFAEQMDAMPHYPPDEGIEEVRAAAAAGIEG